MAAASSLFDAQLVRVRKEAPLLEAQIGRLTKHVRLMRALVDQKDSKAFDARDLLVSARKSVESLMELQRHLDRVLDEAERLAVTVSKASLAKGEGPDLASLKATLERALDDIDVLHREAPALHDAALRRIQDPLRTSGGELKDPKAALAAVKLLNEALKLVKLLLDRRKRGLARLK